MIRLNELHEFEIAVKSLDELKTVLNRTWFDRVKKVIIRWDNRTKIGDGAFNLFRILTEELDPKILNQKLKNIEEISREQRKLRSYRKTRGELASVQTNQILGSLFEVNIVYAAIQSCSTVELFPVVGNGGSDVEAKLVIYERPLFIEAKALTYSNHDIGAKNTTGVGCHSINSMIKQIEDALREKSAKGKQLGPLSEKYPTVLFLALGFNADQYSGSWGIESFFQKYNSNVSSVILTGSAMCHKFYKVFHNKKSFFMLSQKETSFFNNNFRSALIEINDIHEDGT